MNSLRMKSGSRRRTRAAGGIVGAAMMRSTFPVLGFAPARLDPATAVWSSIIRLNASIVARSAAGAFINGIAVLACDTR